MSKSELERLSVLETSQTYFMKELVDIKQTCHDTNTKLDGLIEKLDARYANKRAELALKSLIGIVLGSVMLAILSLILNK